MRASERPSERPSEIREAIRGGIRGVVREAIKEAIREVIKKASGEQQQAAASRCAAGSNKLDYGVRPDEHARG